MPRHGARRLELLVADDHEDDGDGDQPGAPTVERIVEHQLQYGGAGRQVGSGGAPPGIDRTCAPRGAA